MKFNFRRLAALALLAASATGAQAVTCSLHASNVGIAAAGFSCSEAGGVITIVENYTSLGLGSVVFGDLAAGTNYTVVKQVTNSTGVDWSRMANELLDPAGNAQDNLDPAVQPGFVPVGFSTSNDNDGLSFAQGSALARTSTAFADVLSDELTDVRDFIDFFNGTVTTGSSFSMTFGLRDNNGPNGDNQPFLLVQRANESSRLPEPSTMLLVAAALVGVAAGRRRKA